MRSDFATFNPCGLVALHMDLENFAHVAVDFPPKHQHGQEWYTEKDRVNYGPHYLKLGFEIQNPTYPGGALPLTAVHVC